MIQMEMCGGQNINHAYYVEYLSFHLVDFVDDGYKIKEYFRQQFVHPFPMIVESVHHVQDLERLPNDFHTLFCLTKWSNFRSKCPSIETPNLFNVESSIVSSQFLIIVNVYVLCNTFLIKGNTARHDLASDIFVEGLPLNNVKSIFLF